MNKKKKRIKSRRSRGRGEKETRKKISVCPLISERK